MYIHVISRNEQPISLFLMLSEPTLEVNVLEPLNAVIYKPFFNHIGPPDHKSRVTTSGTTPSVRSSVVNEEI